MLWLGMIEASSQVTKWISFRDLSEDPHVRFISRTRWAHKITQSKPSFIWNNGTRRCWPYSVEDHSKIVEISANGQEEAYSAVIYLIFPQQIPRRPHNAPRSWRWLGSSEGSMQIVPKFQASVVFDLPMFMYEDCQ